MSEVTNVKVTKRSRAPAQDHAKPQHQYVVFPLLLIRRVGQALKTRWLVEDELGPAGQPNTKPFFEY